MQVEVTAIDQRCSLVGEGIQNYLVVKLPNENVIRLEVDENTAKLLIEAALGVAAEEEPKTEFAVAPPESYSLQEEEEDVAEVFGGAPQEDLVEWSNLPDNQLSPLMKNVLEKIEAPPRISRAELDEVINAVVEGTRDKTKGHRGPVPPIRTVGKDEMGNPMVPGADADPGEVIGGDDYDEDGVGQL